jgi:hypothetical protein
MAQLTSLNFNGNALGDAGAAVLAPALEWSEASTALLVPLLAAVVRLGSEPRLLTEEMLMDGVAWIRVRI